MVFASLLIAAAAYLLGSIPTGYLLVRIFRHQDIRQAGSGNIGATNVLRSGGKRLGAATFLLDVLKGSSAVWLGGLLGGLLAPGAAAAQHAEPWPPSAPSSATSSLSGSASAAARAWPPASASSWSPRHWPRWPPSPSSRWSSCSAAMSRWLRFLARPASPSLPGSSTARAASARPPFFIAVEVAVALLIIAKHHQNIRRLLDGTESRIGAHSEARKTA